MPKRKTKRRIKRKRGRRGKFTYLYVVRKILSEETNNLSIYLWDLWKKVRPSFRLVSHAFVRFICKMIRSGKIAKLIENKEMDTPTRIAHDTISSFVRYRPRIESYHETNVVALNLRLREVNPLFIRFVPFVKHTHTHPLAGARAYCVGFSFV